MTMKFTRIDTFLAERYKNYIDLSDRSKETCERDLRTQGLIALYLEFNCGIPKEEACKYITDQGMDDSGKDDNGVDGVYYDNTSRILYLLQSKYVNEGNGISSNDVKSFKNGILDIYNTRFDKFGKKLQKHKKMLENAASNLNKIKVILVSNSTQRLDVLQEEVFKSIIDDDDVFDFEFIDFNKTFDFVKQLDSHIPEIKGFKFKQFSLMEGGVFNTYFGIVDGLTLYKIWQEHGHSLLYNNLRGFLKSRSYINEAIKSTIENEPDKFFYYNNGITAICDNIERCGTGDAINFNIKNVSIVNGAQTLGSIGISEYPEKLKDVRVFMRIIQVGAIQEKGALKITKKTNTQNEVDYMDFASLDSQNTRIFEDLYNEGIQYQYKRDNNFIPSDSSISLDEILRTVACCINKLSYVTLAKKYVYRLADTDGTIFHEIINPSLTAEKIKNAVFSFRKIENAISKQKEKIADDSLMYDFFSHSRYFCLFLLNESSNTNNLLNHETLTEDIILKQLEEIHSAYLKHFSNKPVSYFRAFTNVDYLNILCSELCSSYKESDEEKVKNMNNTGQLQLL